MSEKLKRRPKIYLAGSCSSPVVRKVKAVIQSSGYNYPVKFIDPVNIVPIRQASAVIEIENNKAINDCDLMVCVMINQTAGAAIELYICRRVANKPAMVATGVPVDRLTPRVRGLTDAIYHIDDIVGKINGWLKWWYKQA